MEPDFGKYTLALIKEGKTLFSSDKSGMRPIIQCIKDNFGKCSGCELHDKVVGLASARCIVFSGMIGEVWADVASESAEALLRQEGIMLHAGLIVPHILNKDRSAICPMEEKALKTGDNARFFNEICRIFCNS